MVRASAVITQGYGGVRSDKNCTGMCDSTRHLARIMNVYFQVLGCVVINNSQTLFKIVYQNYRALHSTKRLFDAFGVFRQGHP